MENQEPQLEINEFERSEVNRSDCQRSEFILSEAEFLTLLVKHEPAFRGYARSILPDWNLVDEALQEASVTMWQKRDQLENAGGFAPWGKVILRFKCLSQIEKLRARRPLLSDELLEKLAERSNRRSDEDTSCRGRALYTCLNHFSPEHRDLLLAPHRSTDSVVEIAERQKRSPNSLYKLLGRLRERLAECIRLKIASEANG